MAPRIAYHPVRKRASDAETSLLSGRLACTDAVRRGMIMRTHFLPHGLLIRTPKPETIDEVFARCHREALEYAISTVVPCPN